MTRVGAGCHPAAGLSGDVNEREECYMENQAKIVILGAAAVLVSGVKLEDWKLVEKHMPEALQVADQDGDPVFRVAACSGGGSVNQYGICWGNHTDEEGRATVTALLDEGVEDKKAAVTDIMGAALLKLTEMEQAIPSLLEEIREKQQEIAKYIALL